MVKAFKQICKTETQKESNLSFRVLLRDQIRDRDRDRVQMEAVAVVEATTKDLIMECHKKNRIQVSNTKKPLFFYVNLAKRYMQQHNEVELSALGMAIATVVTIAEILKKNGLAIEKKILTSSVDMKDESKGRLVQKAKIEILLGKTENFDNLMTTTTATATAGEEKTENFDNLMTTTTATAEEEVVEDNKE